MLIYSIISLIMSNAVNNRRDSSILYSRISVLILISSFIILYNNFFHNFLYNGIILYNGLLCIDNFMITFILFILLLSSFIISINSVFSMKIIKHISISSIAKYVFSLNLNFFKDLNNFISTDKPYNVDNKIYTKNYMSEQYRIIEYP